ncbi:MAG: outer membrane lipoprotein-sorting protein [Ignavibacteriales bacterium]|nr:outer membrane lipoprotein-sorting protein [Ignavibacteriales bacterium]
MTACAGKTLIHCFLFAVSVSAYAQTKSGDAILRNVEKNAEGVQDFTVTLEGEIDMERLRVPRTTATMFYKKPDKVAFDSQGFGLVPREGVLLNATVLRQRYNSTIVGDDTANGRKVLKLQLVAKDPKTRLRELQLLVDAANWVIVRAQTTPYEGRVLTLEFSYRKESETYWLPRTMRATFGTTVVPVERPRLDSNPAPAGQLEEMQRSTPRSGSITINYTNYRINTNLPDSLFQAKEAK